MSKKTLIIAVIFILVVTALSSFNGLILSLLWNWYIVPVFHLPELTVMQSVGICLIKDLLIPRTKKYISDDDEIEVFLKKAKEFFKDSIIRPLITLIVGWILSFFI